MIGNVAVAAGVGPGQASSSAPAAAERTVWDGVYTAEQAKAGGVTYAELCVSCHDGGDQMAPALTGDAFIATWDGKDLRSLYSRVISTMPADNPGGLSEKTVIELVAFMLSSNRFPAGTTGVSTADELRSIKLTRTK
jgi:quinoprotein glucose dehydrogenase